MVLNLSLSEVVTFGIHYKTHIWNVKVFMFLNRRSDNGMDQAARVSYEITIRLSSSETRLKWTSAASSAGFSLV